MSLDKHATATERKIVHKLVDDALAAGYAISVNDGEATTVVRSRVRATILGAMATTGEDTLVFFLPTAREAQPFVRVGWVSLIYGNGCDIISNSSANDSTDTLLAGAEALAESLG